MSQSVRTIRLPKLPTPIQFVIEGIVSYLSNNKLIVKDLNKNSEVFSLTIENELMDYTVIVDSADLKVFLFGANGVDIVTSTGVSKNVGFDGFFVRLIKSKIEDNLMIITTHGCYTFNTKNDTIMPISLPDKFKPDTLMAYTPIELLYSDATSISIVERTNNTTPIRHDFTSPITSIEAKSDGNEKLTQIAVGLQSGSIVLLNRIRNKFMKSDLKWHSGPVNCLAFSTYTGKLYSGGNEGVLVIWDTQVGTKDFLPRFESPLKNIQPSVNDEHIGIGLVDEQIRVIRTENFETVVKVVALPESLFVHKGDLNLSNFVYKTEAAKYQYIRNIDGQFSSESFGFNPSTRNVMNVSNNYKVKLVESTNDGRFTCSYELFTKHGLVIFDKLRFFNYDEKLNDITLINTIDNPEQLNEIDFICSYFDNSSDGYLIRILFRNSIEIKYKFLHA